MFSGIAKSNETKGIFLIFLVSIPWNYFYRSTRDVSNIVLQREKVSFLEIRKWLLNHLEASPQNRDVPYIAPKKLLLLFHIEFWRPI